MAYVGRFAPSPTGPLHAGSLVAALASWLDAKAQGGTWLVRVEDVDTPRCIPGAADEILRQLAAVGLLPDEPPVYQSQRGALYQTALDQLVAQGQAYPCGCSRRDIETAMAQRGSSKPRGGELIYPGTCRPDITAPPDRSPLQGKSACAWRVLTAFTLPNMPIASPEYAQAAIKLIANKNPTITWQDRRLGTQQQNVEAEVGDFVLRRADGLWAYQLAVVVDDALQGITHVVRGADLADNTARQILLQRALGYPSPQYLHTPLVRGANGEKLSKQNGAQALDVSQPLLCLNAAAQTLGLPQTLHCSVQGALENWVNGWVNGWLNVQLTSI